MKYLAFLIFLLFYALSEAQIRKNYDLLDLNAQIRIYPMDKIVQGVAVYDFVATKNTDSIMIDAPEISISKVKIGCFKAKFNQFKKYLIIKKKFRKGKNYTLKIKYTSRPKSAMYFVGWHNLGRKQVWTQGQGKDNSHWLPSNSDQNDKFTWKLSIDFPKDYQVISNGTKIAEKELNNSIKRHVFKQSEPAPAYLMFIGAGKYISQTLMSDSGVKIYNYQYPDKLKNDRTYYKSKEIFDFLENEIGMKYPWKNYKQIPVENFLYGGMENVSATSFSSNRYMVDSIAFADINYLNVNAHELTHQWFGDLVTGANPEDHWLHESFATYYARLSDRHFFGKNYSDFEIYRYDQQIINAAKTDTIPLLNGKASSLTFYQKGARIIQMMRSELGDKNYKKIIQKYLEDFAYKNATTSDFKRILYKVTKDSLNSFFKLWFASAQIPEYVLIQKKDSILFKQNTAQLPLKFLIISKNKKYELTQSQNFKLPDYKNILAVIPNPDNQKLAQINFKRDTAWIINQILFSPNFTDKLKALKEIREWKLKSKYHIYNQLIEQKNYYPIYGEILKQIAQKSDSSSLAIIKKLFKKDLKTRQEIARSMNFIPKSLKDEYLSLLNDPSYLTIEATLWRSWFNLEKERFMILNKTKNITGFNSHNVRIWWLLLSYLTKDYQPENKQKILDELIDYGSENYNNATRSYAFMIQEQLQQVPKNEIYNLIKASFHFDWRLHQQARRRLKIIYHTYANKNMIFDVLKDFDLEKQKFIKEMLFKSKYKDLLK